MFHLMPHRELPPDFETRYESVWVTPPWWELADARRVGQYYNWTIDELHYAAQCGFDGVCTNEHHQNAYGFMPSPNIMGSVLAKLTNGSNVAIVQMGATLPTPNPPLRVAEEYAMLDCISGGRLVAGLPLGSQMDVNFCYGITPMEHRERYREAFALTLKAWQARGIFPWEGPEDLRGERPVLPAGRSEPMAPPHPAAASAGMGTGLRQHQHVRLRRRQRSLLLLPQLFRREGSQLDDAALLAGGLGKGTRTEPVPGGVPPARRRR